MKVLGGSVGPSVSSHLLPKTVGTFIEDIEGPSANLVRCKRGLRFAAVRNSYLSSPQAWKKQFRCREGFNEGPHQLISIPAEQAKRLQRLFPVCTRRGELGCMTVLKTLSK